MVHKHTSWQNTHTHQIKIKEEKMRIRKLQRNNYMLGACRAEGPMVYYTQVDLLSSVMLRAGRQVLGPLFLEFQGKEYIWNIQMLKK